MAKGEGMWVLVVEAGGCPRFGLIRSGFCWWGVRGVVVKGEGASLGWGDAGIESLRRWLTLLGRGTAPGCGGGGLELWVVEGCVVVGVGAGALLVCSLKAPVGRGIAGAPG